MEVRNLIGERFGKLVVVARHGSDVHGQAVWMAVCDCGETAFVRGSHLTHGLTKSCSCIGRGYTKGGHRPTSITTA